MIKLETIGKKHVVTVTENDLTASAKFNTLKEAQEFVKVLRKLEK